MGRLISDANRNIATNSPTWPSRWRPFLRVAMVAAVFISLIVELSRNIGRVFAPVER
jgi:hypothetical protein